MRRDLSLSPGAMRLALAATVVLTHYLPMSGCPIYLPVDGVPVYGFFFLSGYWITRLWQDKYQKTRNPLLTFYLSRAWRIYPIAAAATMLMFVLSSQGWSGLLSNLVLIGANGDPHAPKLLNPPAWSLAIELQFYALAPFFIVLARNKLAILVTLGVGFVFWLVYAAGVERVYLIHFIFLFGLGVVYARYPRHSLALSLAPYSLGALMICGVGATNPAIGAVMTEYGLLRFAAIAVGVLGIPYVAASLAKQSHSNDRILGDLAYPVYLFHWPAMVMAGLLQTGATLLLSIFLTVGLSLVAHAALDRPLERLRRNFVEGRTMVLPPSIAPATAP